MNPTPGAMHYVKHLKDQEKVFATSSDGEQFLHLKALMRILAFASQMAKRRRNRP